LLKQNQYAPMAVEKQVVSIFAGTNGYLDEIPLEKVELFEKELLEMMDLKHSALLEEIAMKKDLTPEILAKLNGLLREFTEGFKATVKA
jgi:F-type H+-transporting ATPase subunit alpha